MDVRRSGRCPAIANALEAEHLAQDDGCRAEAREGLLEQIDADEYGQPDEARVDEVRQYD